MRNILKKIQRKWLYSVVGLWTALKEEKSLWAYLILVPVILGVGIWVDLKPIEWSMLVLTFFAIIAVEIINTALEAAVDTISFQYNVRVKKIKDIAAGATLVMTTGGFIVLLIIFIPAIQGAI